MISLERAAILLAAGLLPSDELPEVATDALVNGRDSPALRELAGMACTDVRDARDLFVAALDELRIPLPRSDDRKPLAYLIASDITNGLLRPVEGARIIWHHCWWQMGAPEEWAVFVGAASQADDHPENSAELEDLIREAAAAHLSQRA